MDEAAPGPWRDNHRPPADRRDRPSSFDYIGIPGFQFIQDPLDYFPTLHHTNQDVYDHCVAEDLVQSAVVMASFVYFAAMRDEMLPRKPLPVPVEVK